MTPNEAGFYRLCDWCSDVLPEKDYVWTGEYQDVHYPKADLFFPDCPVIICLECDANRIN